jgi:hypothetical protein
MLFFIQQTNEGFYMNTLIALMLITGSIHAVTTESIHSKEVKKIESTITVHEAREMTKDELCMREADDSGETGIDHEREYDKCMDVTNN